MLDTHAKEDGFLSCFNVLSDEFWQNDAYSVLADSLLFVCSGNICCSPITKYIMRHLLTQKDLSGNVLVDSAGCNTRGSGRMSNKAQAVLDEKHIPKNTGRKYFDGYL